MALSGGEYALFPLTVALLLAVLACNYRIIIIESLKPALGANYSDPATSRNYHYAK